MKPAPAFLSTRLTMIVLVLLSTGFILCDAPSLLPPLDCPERPREEETVTVVTLTLKDVPPGRLVLRLQDGDRNALPVCSACEAELGRNRAVVMQRPMRDMIVTGDLFVLSDQAKILAHGSKSISVRGGASNVNLEIILQRAGQEPLVSCAPLPPADGGGDLSPADMAPRDLSPPRDLRSPPPDLMPPPQCSLDSDCRNQQVCYNNKCVGCYRDFHCTSATRPFCQMNRLECSECRPGFSDCRGGRLCVTPPAAANRTNFCGDCDASHLCQSTPRFPRECCRGICILPPQDDLCEW